MGGILGGTAAWTDDVPAGVAVDADGNVFVAGNSPTWQGWATLKYDGESGDLEWITTYTGLDEGQEVAAAIAVSAAGAIHVTGMSSGDYATVKYVERSTGDAVWETDIPVSLAASETRDISTRWSLSRPNWPGSPASCTWEPSS